MSEKLFDPKEAQPDTRRVERVELTGGVVYVKEMCAADTLFCQEHSTRQGGGPASMLLDASALQLWQIVCSCYKGKEPEAPRTFDITDTPVIQRLRSEEWHRLRDAINRVNGMAEEEVGELQDFTGAGGAEQPETRRPGVSSTSAGFPVNSGTSPVPG